MRIDLLKISVLLVFLTAGTAVLAADNPVAKVNGRVITAKDLEAAVDQLIPRATFHGGITEERRSEFRTQALEDLITEELQYQDARERGMKPDKKKIEAQMDAVRSRFKSKKEYKAVLERAGITEEQFRARIEKGVLTRQAIDTLVNEPSKMDDAGVRDYYEKNVGKFRQPESVRLRIISMSNESKAKTASVRIKSGEDFGSVAGTTSEDNYRIRGGDIGYIHRGRIFPELENAALQMKPGEVRGPIRAEGKWFLIKLEDRKPERLMSFDESREKLKKELEKKRAGELMEKWTSELRTKAKIEILSTDNK